MLYFYHIIEYNFLLLCCFTQKKLAQKKGLMVDGGLLKKCKMGLNQRESLFLKEGLTVSFFRFCVPARSLRTKKKCVRDCVCLCWSPST